MQEIKKDDVIFLSENGKIFLSKEACLKEESKVQKDKKLIKIISFIGLIVIGYLTFDAYSYQQNIYNQMLNIQSSK